MPTTIKIAPSKYKALGNEIIVNGRLIETDCRIDKIENVSAGRWEGTRQGEDFVIVGGRASGGGEREWFINFPAVYGDQYVPSNSAAKAVRMIENV